MDLLQKNLQSLKENNLLLFEQVLEHLEKQDQDGNNQFEILQSKAGHLTIQLHDKEGKRFLLSSYNPDKEAQRWASKYQGKKSFIIFGLGFGYHLRHISERAERILVIEPDMELFCLVLRYIDFRWVFQDEKITLLITTPPLKTKSILYRFIEQDEDFILESIAGYQFNYADVFTALQKQVNEAVSSRIVNINTYRIFGRAWTSNFFKNFHLVMKSPGVRHFFERFRGIPAVIISAGPSLNKNIGLLNSLQDKAILIAVGTVYKALKKHGVRPNFIVSVDGGIANYQHFKGEKIKDIPLVFDPVIYPDIVHEYKGPLIAGNVCNQFLAWFEERLGFSTGHLEVGPSVANVSLDLAYKLGADPIIFVGQDLAYTGGKTHAAGTIYEKNQAEKTDSLGNVFVEGINGQEVLSSRSFLTFLRWFEEYIALHPDRHYIDATEGGARIKGTKVLSLLETARDYCQLSYDIGEEIDDLVQHVDKLYEEKIGDMTEAITEVISELKVVKNKAAKGLELVDRLKFLFSKKKPDYRIINSILEQLDQIDQEIIAKKDSKVFLHIIFQPLIKPLLNG
ncbi:MAG: 6-hydroxymethylpterin diphosphokinase MptE-like protein, partial [Halanaerobium sp.]|nr:6-hydroxymethylpterin diphosphokinase MptE-like protein [Halanaerobium sp.]